MTFLSKVTAKLVQRYKVGDTVTMTDNALDNYGEQYRGRKFKITHVATSGRGFDSSAGCALYDLKDFNNALYDYELN